PIFPPPFHCRLSLWRTSCAPSTFTGTWGRAGSTRQPSRRTAMSAAHARLLALAVVALLAAISPVQAQDYFELKKRELALQAQQTTADVLAALETSRKIEKEDPAAAKALLTKRLLEVNDTLSLEDKQ